MQNFNFFVSSLLFFVFSLAAHAQQGASTISDNSSEQALLQTVWPSLNDSLRQKMSGMADQIEGLKNELMKYTDETNRNNNSNNQLSEQITHLNQQINGLGNQMKTLEDELLKYAYKTDNNNNANSQLEQRMSRLNRQIEEVGMQFTEQQNQESDVVSQRIQELEKQIANFNSDVDAIGNMSQQSLNDGELLAAQIAELADAQENTLKEHIAHQEEKIKQTAKFAKATSISLNALQQSMDLSVYLNEITALNNPTTSDIGFSLSNQMLQIIESELFQGRKKVGNVQKSRFFSIVKNILVNPITKAIAGFIPVVNSISNVANTVTAISAADEKVPPETITRVRNRFKVYIEHYQLLAAANNSFETNTQQLSGELEELKIQLHHLVAERAKAFHEGEISEVALNQMNSNQILSKYLKTNYLDKNIKVILDNYENNGQVNYHQAIKDSRLHYPSYISSQAHTIYHKLQALNESYVLELYNYQKRIEETLNNSLNNNIGDVQLVKQKLTNMRSKLNSVENSFRQAVNIGEVQYEFQLLRDLENKTIL